VRAAGRRYQQGESGRQAHRDRQRRYRERQAKACVTHQGLPTIPSSRPRLSPIPSQCAICGRHSRWIDPFPTVPGRRSSRRGRSKVGRSPKNYVFTWPPTVLASQARGALCQKQAQLKEAREGKLDPVYRVFLQQNLEQVELFRRQIGEINDTLARAMQEHTATLVRLTKIPGVDLAAAQELLAEIGPSAATFATPEQFGLLDRSLSGESAIGRRLLQSSFGEGEPLFEAFIVPDCLGRDSHQGPRIEAKGAAWAVAHRIAKVVWLLLHEGVEYRGKGPGLPNPRTLVRKFRRLLQEFARAGLDAKSLLEQGTPATA
jgi:hypothetical protein